MSQGNQSQDPVAEEFLDLLVQLRQHCQIQSSLGHSLIDIPKLPALKLPAPERPAGAVGGGSRQRSRPNHQNAGSSYSQSSSRSPAAKRPNYAKAEPVAKRQSRALFPGMADDDSGPKIEPVVNETPEQLEKRRAENDDKMRELFMSIRDCQKCPLAKGRNKIVFGQGDPAAEIVFIGEAPGADEDREGLAFIGRAGQLLTKMIRAMGLDREDVFIANIAKCRPPGNRKPLPEEMKACTPFLERQLEIIRPKLIVALGKTAGEGLGVIRPEEGLTRNCGFRKRWRGIRVMLTFHPSYLLRNPSAKRGAWKHLQEVMPYIKRRRPTKN